MRPFFYVGEKILRNNDVIFFRFGDGEVIGTDLNSLQTSFPFLVKYCSKLGDFGLVDKVTLSSVGRVLSI